MPRPLGVDVVWVDDTVRCMTIYDGIGYRLAMRLDGSEDWWRMGSPPGDRLHQIFPEQVVEALRAAATSATRDRSTA